MKFQAVAEKTENNFRGLLFCHTWYSSVANYVSYFTSTVSVK